MKLTNKRKCKHKFRISHVTYETTWGGAGSTATFYKEVAYLLCEKCFEVRKVNVCK